MSNSKHYSEVSHFILKSWEKLVVVPYEVSTFFVYPSSVWRGLGEFKYVK